MKKTILLIFSLLFFYACKQDKVDATNIKTFQESVNDMAASLNTIEQIKFNEALYILKTFGVDDESQNDLIALSKLIDGKKTPEILSLADQIAQKNGIEWSSKGTPSLGDANIFNSIQPKEKDANEIEAKSLKIITKYIAVDSIIGAKALQIIPRLVDQNGKPIIFEEAALETKLSVFSNGKQLMSSKNLMQNNNFKGFVLYFSSLAADKISDQKIDINISVETTNKTYKMSNIGVLVNPKALRKEVIINKTEETEEATESNNTEDNIGNESKVTEINKKANPKNTVMNFLSQIGAQNLKNAFSNSENPNWGSYENFANETSGFGSVKSLEIISISNAIQTDNNASINASYKVTDKEGNTSSLKVIFGLKQNEAGEWKITNYKINK